MFRVPGLLLLLVFSFLSVLSPVHADSSLSDCAVLATPVATPVAAFPLTVTDALGREVEIPVAAERIVSLAPSNTEILYALGLEDRVVAVDTFSDYPAAVQEKPRLGSYADPDLEQIVAFAPDLVLATAAHEATVLPDLENLGVTTVVLEPVTLDEVLADIATVGALTGADDAASTLVCEFAGRIEGVEAAVAGAPAPRVFFELSPDLYTAGEGSYIDDLITTAGGENVVGGEQGPWPQIGAEALIAADPEVVLLADHEAGVTPELVQERPGWGEVSAVTQDRVVTLDSDLVARPGPRLVDGLEAIARAIHPDRFP